MRSNGFNAGRGLIIVVGGFLRQPVVVAAVIAVMLLIGRMVSVSAQYDHSSGLLPEVAFFLPSIPHCLVVSSRAGGVRQVACIGRQSSAEPVGYDRRTNTFLCAVWHVVSSDETWHLLGVDSSGKIKRLRLEQLPVEARVESAIVADGTILVPAIRNGRLWIGRFGMNGALRKVSWLTVPGHTVVDSDSDGFGISAGGGMICANLYLAGSLEQSVCVFDASDRLVVQMLGGGAAIDPTGSRVAFSYVSFGGPRQRAQTDPDKICVYDLATKRRSIFCVMPPNILPRVWHPGQLDGVVEMQWDSKGKWLILRYFAVMSWKDPLYGVRMENGVPKWRDLGLWTSERRWLVTHDP